MAAPAAQAGHVAADAARQTTRNKYFQLVGRVGLAAYGLVHFTIAYLAAQVALDARGAKPDKGGALQTLDAQPGGRVLLWTTTVGLATLVLWQLGEAAVGLRWIQPRNKRTRKRIESAVEAAVFGVLALSAGKLHRGVRKTFTADLDLSTANPTARKATVHLGQAGYPALGVAYGIIGALIVTMAATFRPDKKVGFDAALTTLAAQAYGTALLLLVAAGLACFGVYCLFDARYRRG